MKTVEGCTKHNLTSVGVFAKCTQPYAAFLFSLSLCARLCCRSFRLRLLLEGGHLLKYRCILQQLRQSNEPNRTPSKVDAWQFRHLSIPRRPNHIRQGHIHGIFRRYEKSAVNFPILHLYRDLHPLGLEEELDWYPRGTWAMNL